MKKILILVFFFTASCGYQPIYLGKNSNDYIFKEITLTGNDRINKKIVSTLNLRKDNASSNEDEVFMDSKVNISETSKDSKGQITSYRSTIILDFKIKNKNNVVKNRRFIKDFSYNNMKNKFELTEYQKSIEKSLTKKIIEELIIYLDLE